MHDADRGAHQSLGCQVESGFILTGGGAYVDYGTGAGALLWESRHLDANLITWVASSKDHTVSNPHFLHVYAIGVRLKDNQGAYIPAENLRGSVIKFRTMTSSPAVHYPEIDITGQYTLGGGARTAQGSPVNSGVAVALLDADPNWVITGPGGYATWTTGTGRLSFGIKPTEAYQGQISVYSKDHRVTSAGFNTVSLVEMQKYRDP